MHRREQACENECKSPVAHRCPSPGDRLESVPRICCSWVVRGCILDLLHFGPEVEQIQDSISKSLILPVPPQGRVGGCSRRLETARHSRRMKLWTARVVPPILHTAKTLPRKPTIITACVGGGGFGAANSVRALSGAARAGLEEREPSQEPTRARKPSKPSIPFDYGGFLRKHGDSPGWRLAVLHVAFAFRCSRCAGTIEADLCGVPRPPA